MNVTPGWLGIGLPPEDLQQYYSEWMLQRSYPREMQAVLRYRTKNFSQHWLNAMLDVELGL